MKNSKMASFPFKARSIRAVRSLRSRRASVDEHVQLDLAKEPSNNVLEVLSVVSRKEGVTKGRKLGYLNAFVKLLGKVENTQKLILSVTEICCCLRTALINEADEVRAAGLRALRYLIQKEEDVLAFNKVCLPTLVARSLDIPVESSTERTQALRLVRKLLLVGALSFPAELARCLVSLASNGGKEKEQFQRAGLAVLSELGALNPILFVTCGGVSPLMRALLDCPQPRMSEAMLATLLHLQNMPETRWMARLDLQALAAPFTDFHYKHHGEGSEKDTGEDRELRFTCSSLAMLTVLRSWPGILHFCRPENSGLKSLIEVLYLRQLEVRKSILDLMYEVLQIPLPDWTDDFSVALQAADPSKVQDSWRLSEGFVAAEGKTILPHLSKHRPNLIENHVSLLVYTFVCAGLLEALVEVMVTSDTFISVRATILLGEILHLVHSLLPPETYDTADCLPSLMEHVASSASTNRHYRALEAVTALSTLHELKKRGPVPASLVLDHQMQMSGGAWKCGRRRFPSHRRAKRWVKRGGGEEGAHGTLKDTGVTTNKDYLKWDWDLVSGLLKWPSSSLKKLEDSNCKTFIRRLVSFFKPSNSNGFAKVDLAKPLAQIYTLSGCHLLEFLVECDESEASSSLDEILSDVSHNLRLIRMSSSAHDCLFSPGNMNNTVCQSYFLFLGKLTRSSKGCKAMERNGIFQELLEIVGETNHDCYVKLIVSSLDYGINGTTRVIITKALTSPCESCRLYATKFLRVLARLQVADFHKWGIELLVTQLYDQSKAISLAAASILDESCDYPPYLEAVIALRPSLLHLGDDGTLLLIRFSSLPSGYKFLLDTNFLSNEMERWNSTYNYRYVRVVEAALHDGLSHYQRGEDGMYVVRTSGERHTVKDVMVPPHLYGQLVQHEEGLETLVKQGRIQKMWQVILSEKCETEDEILELKASLWAAGHISTSAKGLDLLEEDSIVAAIVKLVRDCPVLSIRATGFYVLGLVATTLQGVALLKKLKWYCVCRDRNDKWAVLEDSFCDNSDQLPRERTLSRMSESSARFYIPDDPESEPEVLTTSGRHRSDTVGTTDSEGGEIAIGGSSGIGSDATEERESSSSPLMTKTPGSTSLLLTVDEDMSVSGKERSRSFTECPAVELRGGSGVDLPAPRTVSVGHLGVVEVSKSRSNSCTDSTTSGVSSCDSGPAAKVERSHTLSPIASSTSLSTVKSGNKAARDDFASRRNSFREPSSGSRSSETGSLAFENTVGYATLRSLQRFRRPLFSDSAMEGDLFSDSRSPKARSLDYRANISPMDFTHEARLARVGSSSSSLSSIWRGKVEVAEGTEIVKEGGQCYMGLALPKDLDLLFPPKDEFVPSFPTLDDKIEVPPLPTRRTSVEEGDGFEFHSQLNCTRCFRMARTRKASVIVQESAVEEKPKVAPPSPCPSETSSTGPAPAAPVPALGLLPQRCRALSLDVPTIAATPGSISSTGSAVETGVVGPGAVPGTHHPRMSMDTTSGKAAVRREVLRLVNSLTTSVGIRTSEQGLLRLKEKYPTAFQDLCLYSEICATMAAYNFRLGVRRFLQELFLDISFEEVYEEAAAILSATEVMVLPPRGES